MAGTLLAAFSTDTSQRAPPAPIAAVLPPWGERARAEAFLAPGSIPRNSWGHVKRSRGNALRALLLGSVLLVPAALTAQETRPLNPQNLLSVHRADTDARHDSVVSMARQQLGRRYTWGGNNPDQGFDCSGFLKYLMRAFGVDLPRTAAQQAQVGQEIPRDPSLLRPGDILTFGSGNRITHVGIYVGNGRYIHASSHAGRIVESNLDRRESSLVRAWRGVRRMLSESETDALLAARQPNTTPARPAN